MFAQLVHELLILYIRHKGRTFRKLLSLWIPYLHSDVPLVCILQHYHILLRKQKTIEYGAYHNQMEQG